MFPVIHLGRESCADRAAGDVQRALLRLYARARRREPRLYPPRWDEQAVAVTSQPSLLVAGRDLYCVVGDWVLTQVLAGLEARAAVRFAWRRLGRRGGLGARFEPVVTEEPELAIPYTPLRSSRRFLIALPHHPPLLACVLRSIQGKLELHAFICATAAQAVALCAAMTSPPSLYRRPRGLSPKFGHFPRRSRERKPQMEISQTIYFVSESESDSSSNESEKVKMSSSLQPPHRHVSSPELSNHHQASQVRSQMSNQIRIVDFSTDTKSSSVLSNREFSSSNNFSQENSNYYEKNNFELETTDPRKYNSSTKVPIKISTRSWNSAPKLDEEPAGYLRSSPPPGFDEVDKRSFDKNQTVESQALAKKKGFLKTLKKLGSSTSRWFKARCSNKASSSDCPSATSPHSWDFQDLREERDSGLYISDCDKDKTYCKKDLTTHASRSASD